MGMDGRYLAAEQVATEANKVTTAVPSPGPRPYRKKRADVLALKYEGPDISKQAVRAWVERSIDERRTQETTNGAHTFLSVQISATWVPVHLGDYIVLDAAEWRVVKGTDFEKQYEDNPDIF